MKRFHGAAVSADRKPRQNLSPELLMMASSLRRCDCFLLAAEWHLEDKMSEPVPVNWTHEIIRSVKIHLINLFIINLMIYCSDQSDIVQQRRMSNLSSCFLLQEQWEEGRGSEETTTWVVREFSDGRVGRIGPGCVLQIKFRSDEFKVQHRYKVSASLHVSFWPESRTEGISVVLTELLPVQVLQSYWISPHTRLKEGQQGDRWIYSGPTMRTLKGQSFVKRVTICQNTNLPPRNWHLSPCPQWGIGG